MSPESLSSPAPVPFRAIKSNHSQSDHLTSGGRSSIPRPLTSIVGRDAEVAAALRLFIDGDTRLLTLTGPGGVGKTRLALRIAEEAAPAFADGVVFVALATLTDPDLVLPTIARALGLREDAKRSPTEILTSYLIEKRLLLVLDNVEQVQATGIQLAALLATCRDLVALVTSRVRLHVAGEQRFPVLPLAVPTTSTSASESGESALVTIQTSPAVQLFVARAQAIDPQFTLNVGNAPLISGICQRLEGLPLAIELAAARSHLFSPADLLARLYPVLPLLSDGPDDAPTRLRTMRDAIAWSYNLLDEDEQALFQRLAVFVDGFTIEAAGHISQAASSVVVPREGLGTADDAHSAPLAVIASLIDKSLLHRTEGGSATRFGMLEIIREYGLEILAAKGEEAEVRDAHATYYLALAARTALLLRGPGAQSELAALEREHGNLRAALAWFDTNGDSASLLRLAAALGIFWSENGHWTEGNRWLERALAADPRPSPARVAALASLGEIAGYQGNITRAETVLQEGLTLARRLGAATEVALMLLTLGAQRVDRGAYEEGRNFLSEALAAARRAGDRDVEALSLTHLGSATWGQGDTVEAAARLRAAHGLAREAGHPVPAAVAARYLGLIATEAGDHAAAAGWYREIEAQDPDGPQALARLVPDVASLALACVETERVARLFGAAAAFAEAIGFAPTWPERGVHERAAAAARDALGDQAFDAAFKVGQSLPQERVLREISAVLDAASAQRAPETSQPYPADGGHGLTQRETEVLRLLVFGATDKEIAAALGMSRRTASGHVAAIRAKLNAPSRAAAAALAVRDRLI